jgi:hypothetical protein
MTRAVLAALLAAAPLAAYAADPIRERYAVYAGGLNIAVIHTDVSVEPGAYRVQLAFRTAGLVGFIVTADLNSVVTGRFDGDTAVPTRFTSTGKLRGGPRDTVIDYVGTTPQVRELVPSLAEDDRDAVPPAQQAGTIDTLSAMAELFHTVNATNRCEGHVTAFDGRRLLSITSRTAGMQELPATDRSSFTGNALRCDLVSQQLGGFKHDADEARMHKPQPGNAWFARLTPNGPLILVRATFPTTFFGSATMYLQPGGE